jgi:hypothetical protein
MQAVFVCVAADAQARQRGRMPLRWAALAAGAGEALSYGGESR